MVLSKDEVTKALKDLNRDRTEEIEEIVEDTVKEFIEQLSELPASTRFPIRMASPLASRERVVCWHCATGSNGSLT